MASVRGLVAMAEDSSAALRVLSQAVRTDTISMRNWRGAGSPLVSARRRSSLWSRRCVSSSSSKSSWYLTMRVASVKRSLVGRHVLSLSKAERNFENSVTVLAGRPLASMLDMAEVMLLISIGLSLPARA